MAQSNHNSRLGFWVNVAILMTLAVVLLNPSGIIGSRIATAFGEWRNNRAVARAWPTLIAAPGRLGDQSQSKQTIVEFIDYECPSCRRMAESVSTAVMSGEIEVVIRHLPLSSIHPNARSAALAAICSEQHEMFMEAHSSLLGEENWGADTDWVAWASRIGIEDTTSFKSCLVAESTFDRIEEDNVLARSIDVTGTPTYVTEQGVFPGEHGFPLALASVGPGSAASRRDTTRVMASLAVTLFDSGEHPSPAVSALASLGRAAILSDRSIALLDEQRLLVVDIESGNVVIAGGNGDGPGEFRAPGAALGWFPSGNEIAVWDPMLLRLTMFAETGELMHDRRFEAAAEGFESVMALYSPLGMFADESLVFMDYPGGVPESGVVRKIRPTVRVVQADAEGIRPLVELPGDEGRDVLFGARSHVVVSNDQVVVADTDADAIEVYNRSGESLFSIPMPGKRVPVNKSHLDAALADAEAEAESRAERRARLLAGAGIQQRIPNRELEFRHRDMSPPIDAMRADADGRLWFRWHVMADDQRQRWSVWDRERELFWIEMPLDVEVMDARGDLLLLRVRDAFDVARAVVRQMVFDGDAARLSSRG